MSSLNRTLSLLVHPLVYTTRYLMYLEILSVLTCLHVHNSISASLEGFPEEVADIHDVREDCRKEEARVTAENLYSESM